MSVHILGIRHHGAGSAQKVAIRLAELQPDIILVEGPPELSEALSVIGAKTLVPPVAIMVYNKKSPAQSSFYPFAEFSPEWVAAQYASKHKVPIRAMDLPAAISWKIAENEAKDQANEAIAATVAVPHKDPLSYLADIAGFSSGEAWWEYHFEQNQQDSAAEHFEAVLLTMKTLREAAIPSSLEQENIAREAYMRQIVQEVQNEMYTNIAVICGAWHVPYLEEAHPFSKADQKIIKALPKSRIDVGATWIPWTNSRLSFYSGYGAGLESPGWYAHRWQTKADIEISWLTKIAEHFRAEDIDISTAHVLETYTLATALAALRNQAHITLSDLNEAIRTVMCMGDAILFELVKEKVIVGEQMGQIPDNLPKVPLQSDFEALAKSLRLSFSAAEKQYHLDLRKPLDLKRSIFFHRLSILGIHWANPTQSRNKGTFKESWVLVWEPAMQITIIDKAYFGNTIEDASNGFVVQQLKQQTLISDLVRLLGKCIPAELFTATDQLLEKIANESAIATDTKELMKALPHLTDIVKYGNVRQSDVHQLKDIVERLFTKICVSLPNTCYGLDEDNSNELFELISQVNHAIKILSDKDMEAIWYRTLEQILAQNGIHSVIIGCTVRLLLDSNQIEDERAVKLMSYYLSNNHESSDAAFWIEGFLRGSGLILIYDNRIWNLLYEWVANIEKAQFLELLPILRRAFSKFEYGERRQIGQKAKAGFASNTIEKETPTELFDETLAATILPSIHKFLGI